MLTTARIALQRGHIPSRTLERIVSRCLEEDPASRWQSAAELQLELGVSRGMRAAAPVPKLNRENKIVLGDFENKTGDPVFDGILRQGLSVQLERSPLLTLVSDQ